MNFGLAIEALKAGKKVARGGWGSKGMFIYLNLGSVAFGAEDEVTDDHLIDGISIKLFETGDTGTVTRLPNLNMKLVSGVTMTGWTPTQADMLAEDWQVVFHG